LFVDEREVARMQFAGFRVVVIGALIAGCGGCANRQARVASGADPSPSDSRSSSTMISGVWDGLVQETLTEGMGAGDTRVEKQEWHLEQRGPSITGFYLAASTFTSGDGRPYVCSRQASFSALVRFELKGGVRDGAIHLEETAQRIAEGRCSPGQRPLARYMAEVKGDVLILVVDGQRQALYRNRGKPAVSDLLASAVAAGHAAEATNSSMPGLPSMESAPRAPAAAAAEVASGASPIDVSGVWIWEHRGAIPTGDEKMEREEWHVEQEGARLSGYYDRVVREISTDGHAFRCSMDTEFEIATRYKFRGEVRGNQLMIYESSYEVLEPSACDNGQRRLDAYEGLANGDEVRLIWGVGGQVLRRPRPDVPTQRF
jgi:hypothetical protein